MGCEWDGSRQLISHRWSFRRFTRNRAIICLLTPSWICLLSLLRRVVCLPWCGIIMCYRGYGFDDAYHSVLLSAQRKKKIRGYLSIGKMIQKWKAILCQSNDLDTWGKAVMGHPGRDTDWINQGGGGGGGREQSPVDLTAHMTRKEGGRFGISCSADKC